MDAIGRFAFRVLGPRVRKNEEKYHALEKNLRQARIATPYDMYVARAMLYSLIIGLVGALVGLAIFFAFMYTIGIPKGIFKFTVPPYLWWTLDYRETIFAIFLVASLAILFGFISYLVMLAIPGFKAGERKTKIDIQLPHAAMFMYALSKGGLNIIDIFRSLSESSAYGEVAKEAGMIIRNMDYFGQDLRTAIQNVSETSPSENFQDLVDNLLSVIDSGGSITTYLSDKSEQYLERAVRSQRGFLEMLGLIAESYVTAFVAGPLFIMVMYTVMATMSPGPMTILYIIIYAVIPIGSAMFIVLISMMSPEIEKGVTLFEIKEMEEYRAQSTEEPREEEERLFKRLEKGRKTIEFKKFLENPLRSLYEKPLRALYISVPVGIVFFIIELFLHMGQMRDISTAISVIDDYIVFTLLIVLLPLAVFFELSARREKKIADEMPDFLKKLASANESGLTLTQSIELIAKSSLGALGTEIRKMWRDVQWGMEIEKAFKRFGNRIKTSSVSRIVTLITKANRASGETKDVLAVGARDAASHQVLKEERFGQMIIYVVIVYMAFFVFLFIIATMTRTFLPVMAGAERTGVSGAEFMRAFDIALFNRIFFHACVIQGFCSGLIAGQMGEGNVLSGLKHSIIMVSLAYLVFTLFI
ncbi:MAG: type II secretion system F family protein [Methanocellales archaeon]|nr:type II secretion system F family protein [Methanocellales archaeon]